MAEHLYTITQDVIENLPERTQEVLLRRFGIAKGRRETLEAIGRGYDITRERVRQIEASALKQLQEGEHYRQLSPFIEALERYMHERGGVMAEHDVLSRFANDNLHDDTMHSHVQGCVLLLLNVGDQFYRLRGTDEYHPHWITQKEKVEQMKAILQNIKQYLAAQKTVISLESLADAIEHDETPDTVDAYIGVSKFIGHNQFDHYGLSEWPEITPKGVKDKAYLVLKHVGKPLHFTAVADMINEMGLAKRPALAQTVHNELIKDSRFVLIGRGIYALTQWGYEPGTVKDVLMDVLKQSDGPIDRDRLVEQVLQKRQVKPNTVILNLHNRPEFKRDSQGRYYIA